jgi:uncharacterized membrane protein YqjE
MAGEETHPAGLAQVLRRIGETVLLLIQNRLELAAVELGEEKYRIIEALFWFSAFVFSVFMAAILVTFGLIYWLWDKAGGWGIALFCVLYALGAAGAGIKLKQHLQSWPLPFAQTLAEIKKDQLCLRTRN